ncbi:MAG: 2Fe-2S iron-sulfur cluster binding domain-containing protein [Actinobacteria bacterium]|nr:2Fe-2S iron-sulfur cluster binding domain-containing protein [Actinomycetota bacterium]
MSVSLNINGRDRSVNVDGADTLLDVLREQVGLLGTKEGCVEGECGACTVLIDGAPVDSCIYAAAAAGGRQVTTIEGLARPGDYSPIQQAFIDGGGVQCGFCTPGFIVTLTALLRRNPDPSRDEINNALSGNICRCTGYSQIIEAALLVAAAATSTPTPAGAVAQ